MQGKKNMLNSNCLEILALDRQVGGWFFSWNVLIKFFFQLEDNIKQYIKRHISSILPNQEQPKRPIMEIRLYREVLMPMALIWAVMAKYKVPIEKAFKLTTLGLQALDDPNL
jgi:hypothetical protein